MLLRKIALVLLVASLGYAHADPGQTRWIATPNRAYAAMPATSLTDGRVSHVAWSPDGEHLLVAERPITTSREQLLRFGAGTPSLGSLQLIGWDRRFRQIRNLWSTEDATATVEGVAWLKGTSVALVTVRWIVRDGAQGAQHPTYGVLDVDAANGKYRWVPGMEQLVARPFVSPSPARPIAAVVFSDNPETGSGQNIILDLGADESKVIAIGSGQVVNLTGSGGSGNGTQVASQLSFTIDYLIRDVQATPLADNFWNLDAGGNILHSIKVEKPIQLPLVWNLDGSAWFLVDTDPKTKSPVLARLTDQGSLVPSAEQEFVAKEAANDLAISSVSAAAKQGKSQENYQILWLRSQKAVDHGEMMLSADGEWPELSPSGNGVFYIDAGVAKVRELIPLTADQQRAAGEAPKTVELARTPGQVFHISSFTTGAARPAQP